MWTGKYSLGCCYHDGEGVAVDKADAARWFLKSAEQGDEDAMRKLVSHYRDGDGVEQDEAEAARWEQRLQLAGSEAESSDSDDADGSDDNDDSEDTA